MSTPLAQCLGVLSKSGEPPKELPGCPKGTLMICTETPFFSNLSFQSNISSIGYAQYPFKNKGIQTSVTPLPTTIFKNSGWLLSVVVVEQRLKFLTLFFTVMGFIFPSKAPVPNNAVIFMKSLLSIIICSG